MVIGLDSRRFPFARTGETVLPVAKLISDHQALAELLPKQQIGCDGEPIALFNMKEIMRDLNILHR